MPERPGLEVIRSLTDIESVTKAVISSINESNNDRRGNTSSIENLVEDSVKQLYPNVRQSNPSLGSSCSSNRSLVKNPKESYPTPREKWSQSFKGRSDK